MSHSINQDITPLGLFKFAAPSIVMMVFMSLYTIVDGIFVSRFLGSNALSALNIVYPVINVAIALSTMIGTGGSAIISKYLGERKKKRAREALTQFVLLTLLLSVILLADCRIYLGASMLFIPACMLQTVFQSFSGDGRTSGIWACAYGRRRHFEYASGLCDDCASSDGNCRRSTCYRHWAVHPGGFGIRLFYCVV